MNGIPEDFREVQEALSEGLIGMIQKRFPARKRSKGKFEKGRGIFGLLFFVSLFSLARAWAASPSLTVGSVSGPAGTAVALPVTFDPSTATVASLQFSLLLPPGISTGAVTAGPIMNSAGKLVAANQVGNAWNIIVYGLNQTAISAGSLLTVQLTIAPGTALGNFGVGITGTLYSDPNGKLIPPGSSAGGTVTVQSGGSVGTGDPTPGLRSVMAFPNPAVHQDPTIRAMVGVVNSVEITIFDLMGHVVNSATLTGAPSGIVNGQYYYDYTWTGSKASGIYFAVIHAKASDGSTIKARTRIAVVR